MSSLQFLNHMNFSTKMAIFKTFFKFRYDPPPPSKEKKAKSSHYLEPLGKGEEFWSIPHVISVRDLYALFYSLQTNLESFVIRHSNH